PEGVLEGGPAGARIERTWTFPALTSMKHAPVDSMRRDDRLNSPGLARAALTGVAPTLDTRARGGERSLRAARLVLLALLACGSAGFHAATAQQADPGEIVVSFDNF